MLNIHSNFNFNGAYYCGWHLNCIRLLMKHTGKYHILSIDGGGLKGLIAIKILQIIENITGKRITDIFELISGTSTGGLIASGMTVKNIDGKPLHDLTYIESMYLEAIESLMQNRYGLGKEPEKLSDLILRTVGHQKLSDTYLPVFVPTYDLSSKRIVVFKTRSAILNESKNITLFDVCKATSAIPQIFPSHKIRYNKQELNCVDAGWHIKNPALAALAEFWKHRSYYSSLDIGEENVVLVSISTGNFYKGNEDWTTNIDDIISSQRVATKYIGDQKLNIDLSKINFLRVDLNFGNQGYSFKTLTEISNKIDTLSKDKKFAEVVSEILI